MEVTDDGGRLRRLERGALLQGRPAEMRFKIAAGIQRGRRPVHQAYC